MPCPHCKITIIKRSNNESAVSAAAYQSGEKLFSEYDQEQKYYPYKNEVTHKEILLPPHVPPEYADRNTLWNSAEAQEKQWNSQLARRFVLAIPREIPSEQRADLIRDYCREFFVSKGMIADFVIHDKGDGNPHAHILLTMRAMDEKGRWLPKSRKVYDLDGSRKDLEPEREQLAAALPGQRKELEAVQADVKILRDVRHWLNQVLPSEQYRQTADPGRKPSVQESLKGRQERIRQEQAAKSQPPRTQKQQNMEL